MAYTETTRTSYGQRLGNSFKGIGSGILMFVVGTVLLWWNEGRAVKTTKMLKEAQGQVVEMTDVSKIDPAFEGKLIHAYGFANTADSLFDSQFNVGVRGIALHRESEYYQWVEDAKTETKDKIGGAQETTTTYTYHLDWTPGPVDSGSFHDPDYQGKNSVKQNVDDLDLYATDVSFGAYKLSPSQIKSVGGEEPLYVDGESNVIYIGEDPGRPEVGDVRITFTKVVPCQITVVSKVNGNSFVPFVAKNGKEFTALRLGEVPQEQIFEEAHQANKIWLWVLRVLGFFLVAGGLKGIFNIIETLLKVLPFLANIVGWGVGLVCNLIAFVWSLIIIAIAWLAYRPVLGISLLVIAAAAVWYFATHKKKGAAPEPPAPAQEA